MNSPDMKDVYEHLENYGIGVAHATEYKGDAKRNGWYFYDNTYSDNDFGDGVLYTTKDEAAIAALEYAEDQHELEYGERDDFMTDAEADADVLRLAGMGTDEDYGCFSGEEY